MILHIYERCNLYLGFESVVIATCDKDIYNVVTEHGGTAVMTSATHERATDRVEEAIKAMKLNLDEDDFVLMVQGDEIFVSPEIITQTVDAYLLGRYPVTNLVTPLYRKADIDDPNTVKVVGAENGRALYMSRAPIPSSARMNNFTVYQQTGIIGFSAYFLCQYALLDPTPLEAIESIDMLRVIEHGHHLQLVYSDSETIGVDTPEELIRAEKLMLANSTAF